MKRKYRVFYDLKISSYWWCKRKWVSDPVGSASNYRIFKGKRAFRRAFNQAFHYASKGHDVVLQRISRSNGKRKIREWKSKDSKWK